MERMTLLSLPVLLLVTVIGIKAHPCDVVPGNFDSWSSAATKMDVVIVGGGIAGISALEQFQKSGNKKVDNVILLEAQDYLGGRVKTVRTTIPETGKTVLTEDGAEWVHGGDTTNLYTIANQLNGLSTDKTTWDVFFRRNNGAKADAIGYDIRKDLLKQCETMSIISTYYNPPPDKGFGQCFIDRFNATYDKFNGPADERDAWYFYNQQMVNKDQGIDSWLNISARDAMNFRGKDQWDQWKDGYVTLTNYLLKDIPQDKIKTSTPVCRIFWNETSSRRAIVVTKDGTSYSAKHVLVTSSVGFIKKLKDLIFSPALPDEFLKNLEGISLGVADKIQLGWKSPWWGNNYLDLSMIWTSMQLPAEMKWLYGIMEFLSIHQYPEMIQAFITGTYAKMMEDLSEETVKNHIMTLLNSVMSRVLKKQGLTEVPAPIFFRRTTWGKHEWMYGSYNSYVTPKGSDNGLKTRNPFITSIKNHANKEILFWAGEFQSTERYGTVDGAMDFGKKMAKKIQDLLIQ